MSEIKLSFDGKEYSLTYTRESVRQMERQGFSFVGFANGEKPATYSAQMFEGAFIARHRKMSRKAITEIYDHLDDKADLLAALAELYNATLETMVDTAAEDDGKKATWARV